MRKIYPKSNPAEFAKPLKQAAAAPAIIVFLTALLVTLLPFTLFARAPSISHNEPKTYAAYNGFGSGLATVSIAVNANAELANLAISKGSLSPAFAANTTGYTVAVANTVTSLKVTPTTSDANATVKVNGIIVKSGKTSANLPLSVGPNTITTVVTAQDGTTTKTYTITVTRLIPAPIIRYQGPQTYLAGTAITPLGPASSSNVAPSGYTSSLAIPGFVTPDLLAIDGAGNKYVVDFGTNILWKLPAGGGARVNMAIFAAAPQGLAVDAAGNVYAPDNFNHSIVKFPVGGGGPVTLATGFDSINGIAADAGGNIYVADHGDGTIVKLLADGHKFLVGGVSALPTGIAVDGKGNVYFADDFNNTVEMVPVSGGSPVIISSGFNSPKGVAVDASGNIYVADYGNGVVKKILAPASGGSSPVIIASGFTGVFGIVADAENNVYASDPAQQAVRQLKPVGGYFINPALPAGLSFDGATGTISGTPANGSPATTYTITAYNSSGNGSATVRIKVDVIAAPAVKYNGPQTYTIGTPITPLAPISSRVAPPGYSSGTVTIGSGFYGPEGVAIDAAGNVYIADYQNDAVKKILAGGGAPVSIGSGFSRPTGVAVDAAGNVYVADYGNSSVKKIPVGGGSPLSNGSGFVHPFGIAVDAGGNVYVGDNGNNTVMKIPVGGGAPVSLGSGFNFPDGVAVDTAGNVYVADHFHQAIKKIPVGGGSPVIVSNLLHNPDGVAVDAAGNVYVADTFGNAVKEIPAGGGSPVTLGSGFNIPIGIAISATGNLYVGDFGNDAVKIIRPVGGYFINPALPAGLRFDNSTGIISGTPVAASPATKYTITAYNLGGAVSATVKIGVLSNNANLAGLAISAGTLTPVFAAGTISYTALVGNEVTSVKVTPTTSDANATVKVNGIIVKSGKASTNLPLSVGANTIATIVKPEDGTTTKTYTITVTRAPSSNANLSNLKISKGILSPSFATATTSYTASVNNNVTVITETPKAADATAIIKVNGAIVISGMPSASLPLLVGDNTITTVVTAQNGTTIQTYIVTIARAAGPIAIPAEWISAEKPTNLPEDGITMHQGVSPNGDGFDDVLIIDGITNYPDNKLLIMNRGGVLVYRTNGYDNSSRAFDGHSNRTGAMQLPGTYFYSLEYKAGKETKHKTGFVVLKY